MNTRLMKVVTTAAVALGIAGGSYGIASAASGSGSTTTTTTPTQAQAAAPQQPWGHQRSDETLLTGDTLAKVKAAAASSIGSGTIERVETDADGHAAYEVHFVKADGTPATVYVDDSFKVVSVESR